jgi:hypothetical protein
VSILHRVFDSIVRLKTASGFPGRSGGRGLVDLNSEAAGLYSITIPLSGIAHWALLGSARSDGAGLRASPPPGLRFLASFVGSGDLRLLGFEARSPTVRDDGAVLRRTPRANAQTARA